MPFVKRAKLDEPAAWRITKRPLVRFRGNGPGVGDHASPVSSSRTNMHSALGSVTGSFENGVSRFSRLFSAHVNADPDAVTMVPNVGLAMTLAHGKGVSPAPSRTTTYSRPSTEKPPRPLPRICGGISTSACATDRIDERREPSGAGNFSRTTFRRSG